MVEGISVSEDHSGCISTTICRPSTKCHACGRESVCVCQPLLSVNFSMVYDG